jgi:predicted molibdopterin-dependent oxidoreductase YjgC
MCDEGRYGFAWIDEGRLMKVLNNGIESTWDEAIAAITAELASFRRKRTGSRVGVIASAQLTNEELFLIREIFRDSVGAHVTASVAEPPGDSDDFLLKADRNPNTLGATLLGLCGPSARSASDLIDAAVAGHLDVLWVFGHDVAALFGKQKLEQLSQRLHLFIFSGTNENATASAAHWVLPTAAYVEKDGTFVNCQGRIQRIGRAFAPLPNSREDWRLLLEMGRQLNVPTTWRNPQEIFLEMAERLTPFAGLSYEKIGSQGAALALAQPVAASSAP